MGIQIVSTSLCENIDGLYYLKDTNGDYSYLISADTSITSYTVHDECKIIAGQVFYKRTSISSISIPEGIICIGEKAFKECSGLTGNFDLSNCISIGSYAFQDCSGLTGSLELSSVTSIGGYAFEGCIDLTSVTIGSGVSSIGTSAFYNCTNLTSITIKATTPPTLGTSAIPTTATIYVPSGCISAYATAWGLAESRFAEISA